MPGRVPDLQCASDEHHRGLAGDAAGAAGERCSCWRSGMPRLELANTHIRLALLPGSFCLATFRIRSGKEMRMGRRTRRYQAPILTASCISSVRCRAPAESDYQGAAPRPWAGQYQKECGDPCALRWAAGADRTDETINASGCPVPTRRFEHWHPGKLWPSLRYSLIWRVPRARQCGGVRRRLLGGG